MEARTESRTSRKAAANRRVIVEAAQAILAAEGAAGLTLEAVATRADVAVQTVYNRVGGRPALLAAVAELAMQENRAYMDAAYGARGTAEERLLMAAAAYVRFARERPHEFRVLVDPPGDDPGSLDRIATLVAEQNDKLAGVVRDGIAEGTVRADLDPDRVAVTLWATMSGLLALSWRADRLAVGPEAADALMSTFVTILADGLRADR